MKSPNHKVAVAAAALTLAASPLFGSSHQDAPLAVLDPAANTTDVYAFVDQDDGNKSLVVALGDRKSTRLNSSHLRTSRMPSSA